MKDNDTIRAVIQHIAHALRPLHLDTHHAESYAWWILEGVTQASKIELLTEKYQITRENKNQINVWLDALIHKAMPLQYLLKTISFCSVTLEVAPPILIPRPETENWCNELIDNLKKLKNQTLTLLDIGCGTGCISIALAKEFPQATVYALDISPAALALTEKNKARNNVYNVITLQSDLFTALAKEPQFDLIVSNPPYIDPAAWNNLDTSVTAWEDYNALCAPQAGLALIKKIIEQAPAYIKKNEALQQLDLAQLIVEIGYDQGTAARHLMQTSGYNQIKIVKDFAAHDRIIMGRIDYVENTKN
jgi:release factor glutamine methyltransferase